MRAYQGEICEDPYSGSVEAGETVSGSLQGTAAWYEALFPDPDPAKYPMPWESPTGPPFLPPSPSSYPRAPFPGLFHGLFD
jgi:hypothetical protein